MSDHVAVDPVDLLMSADHLGVHSADLLAAHSSAYAEIEATLAGWAGASALAMQAKLAEWQAFTSSMCGKLDAHQAQFLSAGKGYDRTDDTATASLGEQIL